MIEKTIKKVSFSPKMQ